MSIPGTIWLSMWGAGEHPGDADFAAVGDCGVITGVEIWTEHPGAAWEIEAAVRHGLQVGIHLPFHDLNPVSDDPVVADRALARNREWLRALADHGGVHAVLHGGYAATAVDRAAKLARLVEFASTLHAEAAALGIELLLENLIPDKLGYSHIMASNLAEWSDLVDHIGCGAVLDTGHSAVTGIALADVFDTLGSTVRAIHLSDNDGVSDLHLLPGDGNDVTAGLAGILSGIGYDGIITYEISPLRYSLADILRHIAADAAR
ncbi:MAG: sugar phosphate isomerase/epimerase [Mycobacterium sp.]|nr:sugar phosphate isomerase/epimerase [Mycobacterium sp.]